MIDVIFGILFLYLVLVGAYRGFVELFVKSAGIVAGFFLSFKFVQPFSKFLSQYFNGSPQIIQLFAFFIILITVFGISFFLYSFLKSTFLKKKKFSFWDKVLGASGGALIFLVIISSISYYSEKNSLLHDLTSSSKILDAIRR